MVQGAHFIPFTIRCCVLVLQSIHIFLKLTTLLFTSKGGSFGVCKVKFILHVHKVDGLFTVNPLQKHGHAIQRFFFSVVNIDISPNKK